MPDIKHELNFYLYHAIGEMLYSDHNEILNGQLVF